MRISWRSALGIGLSAVLLWWTLRDVEFGEVWQVLRRSNLALFVLAALTATLQFPLRAWRWRYILEPVVPDLPLGTLFRAVAVGMMVNNTLPARAGEFARAYAVSREDKRIPFVAALASLVIDRVFDAIVIVVLLVGAMLTPSFPGATMIAGQPLSRIALLVTLGAVALLAGLLAVAVAPLRMIRLFDLLSRWISPVMADKGGMLLQSFADGLGSLRSPRLALTVLFWTVIHWIVGATSFYIGFLAIGLSAPYAAALFLQSIIALGVAAPSSPGFFGLFEFFGREGLGVYGVSQADAVSWALGYHILAFIPITVMGAWYFTRMGLHIRDIQRQPEGAA